MTLSVSLLILIDQFIKIYINNNLMNVEFYIFKDVLGFKPILNTSYSWINSLMDFGIGLLSHITFNILALLISLIIYDFIRQKQNDSKIVKLTFVFWFAGSICSTIDRIFWRGSLDYIYLKNLFTFDLKDVYITIVEAILISSLIFNFNKIRRIDDKLLYRDFKSYMKEKYLK